MLISLSVGGLLGPDTVQPLECSCLADGLEGFEGLHISGDGHGTGPLGHSQLHGLGHLLSSGVTLPWLLGVDGEQDHLRLELLQPLSVQLQRLHTLVPATVVNSNTNGPGELLAQTSSLDFLKCEPTSSPLLEVVLVGWAGDHRPQLSDGTRGNLSSLGNPVLAPADLPGRLVEPSLHIVLPVLVEVLVRH